MVLLLPSFMWSYSSRFASRFASSACLFQDSSMTENCKQMLCGLVTYQLHQLVAVIVQSV
ncbi:hypothetical protein Ahy_A03g014648 isoform B [Arachis hypogaea]|uniref:Uncharacterized protein n=1 Tax=Arachis hypogaea TaxID=3818 RepID=A0A445DY91_ARAHY|nr:hypothetical protein Ahy_A03g014648 isoform B [Arachis hypogaea]